MKNSKEERRYLRHKRIRKKLTGTSEQPRLVVHRSSNNFYAQIVDDSAQKVIMGKSTLSKELKTKVKNGGNVDAAAKLGEIVATLAKGNGIERVCFDRGGYLYHGRVKAFAEAARKGGLEF